MYNYEYHIFRELRWGCDPDSEEKNEEAHMKSIVYDQQSSSHRLTRLYIGALSTIALLALLGQIVIQFSLLRQSSDALVINLAGRQRMLSQELTKAALAIYVTTEATTRATNVAEMRSVEALWIQSHNGLQHGDAGLGLPGNNSDVVKRLFASIQPSFQAMVNAADQLLIFVGRDQASPITILRAGILPFLQILLTQVQIFLPEMNTVVSQYQSESEGRVNQLKVIELSLLVLTLVVLAFEGSLIFRPALQRLGKSVKALTRAEQQIADHMKELEHKSAELEVAFAEAMAAHRKVMPHARVVAFGRYQVQGAMGSYYAVESRQIEGNLLLTCECPMYHRNLICTHSLAAASLHSALLRNQQHGMPPSPSKRIDSSALDFRNQLKG